MPSPKTLPVVDAQAAIATMRVKLLNAFAALGSIADELHDAAEIIRNPSPDNRTDNESFECCMREAIDAGMLAHDQVEELMHALETLANLASQGRAV